MTAPDDPGTRYRAAVVALGADFTTSADVTASKPPRPDVAPVVPLRWPRGPADLNGAWPRPDGTERCAVLTAAAEMAQVVYPGPVGELVSREIRAYQEIGHRFGGDALMNRLIAHLNPPTEGTPS